MGSMAALAAQSFRRGLRLLWRDGIFTVLAVGLLGVGLAATMALLAAIDAVILRPLPYPQPEQIFDIFSTRTTQNQGVVNSLTAIPDLREWQRRCRSMALVGYAYAEMSVGGAALEPELVQGARISTDYFEVSRNTAALGRLFRSDEGVYGAHHVAIISDAYWHRRFDGASDIIGRSVLIDGEPHTIVGVMPPGMNFVDDVPPVHVFTPLAVRPGDPQDSRALRPLLVFARLRDGFTEEQGRAELTAIARQIASEDPANAGIGVNVQSPLERSIEYNGGALAMLLGGVGLLLLTACLNAVGLLLTRTVARRAEFGLRTGLGASRGQVVLQVLVENLPIALLSALIALPLAYAMVGAMGSLLPWTLPRYNVVVLNLRVLAVVSIIWIALTLGVSLPPVLQAGRIDLVEALGGHTRASGQRLPSVAVRKVLMVCQIAFAVALLLGAQLLARTTSALHHVMLGFATEQVATFRIPFPALKYEPPAAIATADRMLAGVRTLPGVRGAGLGSMLSMGHGAWWIRRVMTEASRALPIAQVPQVKIAFAGPGFFEALGVTLREGRFVSDRDIATSEPIAIVNESFVRTLLKTPQAVGQRVRIIAPGPKAGTGADREAETDERTIVGVIANISDSRPERPPEPEVYVPLAQAHVKDEGWSNTIAMAVATADGIAPNIIIAAARQQVAAIDPAQPISQVFTTADLLERRLVRPTFNVQMMTAVAILATACVSLGIFGVFAYVARLRTTEFAVRLAMGARPAEVAGVVLKEAAWLSAFGLIAGVVATTALVPVFRAQLYGVATLDAGMIAGAAVVIAAVTMASLVVPLRFAARVDATAALR